MSINLVERIQNLIASDDVDQGERMVRDFQTLSQSQREAVDDIFICLCGYRLTTLIEDESLGEEL